uniref:Max dimerization protein 3 n=1 Tax=Oncorhynchus mykiss TaxID=8022 RepID=A0A8K9WPF9_ONCMY
MDANTCNIQVLLQAAEFLERREREAEHGYASVLPFYCPGDSEKKSKQKNKKLQAAGNVLSCNIVSLCCCNRRAQLRHHLEQLKQQVPQVSDSMRNTTLNLLRRAQTHIKKLQDQDERAEQLKGRLRWEQRELRVRLEQLQGHGAVSERMRNDSLGSAAMSSSERSDSDREDVEVDVESIVFDCLDSDGLGTVPHTGTDHCYSSSPAWAGL